VYESAKKIWRENVLNVRIPHSTAFSKAYDQKVPLPFLEQNHPGAQTYGLFADWLIKYETNQS
jgi:cellulose biosynthesis protein BcsQ